MLIAYSSNSFEFTESICYLPAARVEGTVNELVATEYTTRFIELVATEYTHHSSGNQLPCESIVVHKTAAFENSQLLRRASE